MYNMFVLNFFLYYLIKLVHDVENCNNQKHEELFYNIFILMAFCSGEKKLLINVLKPNVGMYIYTYSLPWKKLFVKEGLKKLFIFNFACS